MITRKTNSMSLNNSDPKNHEKPPIAATGRKQVAKKGSLTNACEQLEPSLLDIPDGPKDLSKTMNEGKGKRKILSKRATDSSVD